MHASTTVATNCQIVFKVSFSSRAPSNFCRSARISAGVRAANRWGLFLPAANASGDCLNGLVAKQLFAVARVIAAALLELAKESSHAERSKRIGQRLAT